MVRDIKLDCDLIQTSVIDTRKETFVLLDKEELRGSRRCEGMNETLG